MNQIDRIQRRLLDLDAPAALIVDPVHVQWATGFSGSSGAVIVSEAGSAFVTDSRYGVQAHEEVTGCSITIFQTPKTLYQVVADELKSLGVSALIVEDSMSLAALYGWQNALQGVELTPTKDMLAPLAMIKTSEEVAIIEEACKVADACFDHVRRMIQVGVSEIDIAIDIDFYMRRQGARSSFETIAVSGPNSAKPHGKPTERKLQPGDFLTLDFGAMVQNYCSDMTRTLMIGEPTPRHLQIYNRVLESQVAAIEAIAPGANGKEVDGLVRTILDKDDFAKYFGHGLGHGLGRRVHDPGALSMTRDQPIEVGQVWTVEPGVYIEGFGGVRIEDDVVVTPEGCRVLTHSPKELIVCS
ncbi:MAG: aminopeptidase P family protein [Chthonomonas sp.]|nr:aminopeptidase P family protein [Chthonomonas sp.]